LNEKRIALNIAFAIYSLSGGPHVRVDVVCYTILVGYLHIRSTRELTISETPIITVIGKAFWNIGHAPKDQSNRRKRVPQYAVWDIHPVMAPKRKLRPTTAADAITN
jgi:hypothetical protein